MKNQFTEPRRTKMQKRKRKKKKKKYKQLSFDDEQPNKEDSQDQSYE